MKKKKKKTNDRRRVSRDETGSSVEIFTSPGIKVRELCIQRSVVCRCADISGLSVYFHLSAAAAEVSGTASFQLCSL